MKKTLHLIVVFWMLSVALWGQTLTALMPQGSGTPESPYLISDLSNLLWLSQNSSQWGWSTYYLQTANIDASSTSTWNDGKGWVSIGNSNNSFSGIYDGGGYSISGLTINRPDENNMGLFGRSSGKIANLQILNANVKGNEETGALVGYNSGT
ncbi:hypothetical protein LX69_00246, partial [Breznakibacter xylanolyticus]